MERRRGREKRFGEGERDSSDGIVGEERYCVEYSRGLEANFGYRVSKCQLCAAEWCLLIHGESLFEGRSFSGFELR